jgi:tetratricopeptide (TPR) repeat protein
MQLKPLYDEMVMNLAIMLAEKGRKTESEQILTRFLQRDTTKPKVWGLAAKQLGDDGKHESAIRILDSAVACPPADTLLSTQLKMLLHKYSVAPYEDLYDSTINAMNLNNYLQAIGLLEKLAEKKPRFAEARANLAFCLFITGKYPESIDNINQAYTLGWKEYSLLSIRGEIYRREGNPEAACHDFKEAMEHGNRNGAASYKKYCENHSDVK